MIRESGRRCFYDERPWKTTCWPLLALHHQIPLANRLADLLVFSLESSRRSSQKTILANLLERQLIKSNLFVKNCLILDLFIRTSPQEILLTIALRQFVRLQSQCIDKRPSADQTETGVVREGNYKPSITDFLLRLIPNRVLLEVLLKVKLSTRNFLKASCTK